MNVNFLRYDPATGRVLGLGNCAEMDYEANRSLVPGDAFLVGHADLDADWVNVAADPPEVQPRPELAGFSKLAIAADGIDEAVLELDRPFSVTIDGDRVEVNEPGESGTYRIALAAMLPATWVVEVEAFPALPYRAEIVAA
jgi:hypothetical protein